MRNFGTLAAIFVLLLFANLSWAQATISFDAGYPKAGACSGTILMQGTIKIDDPCGIWNPVGSATWTVWQDDGLLTSDSSFTIVSTCIPKQYTWSGVVSGLQSSVNYNATVEITISDGCDPVTAKTKLATVTTK